VVLFGIKLFNGNYNFPLNNNKMNATANKTSTPKIIVKNDYDGVFENRVKSAIELNQSSADKLEEFKNLLCKADLFI
jgi:hypothetical protein